MPAVTILDEILDHKRRELAFAQQSVPPEEMAARARRASDRPRGFRRALLTASPPAIIAEIKRRSPSRGEIRSDFDPAACATAYAEGGAAAISVLTDARYFGGRGEFLAQVRATVGLPILRKDFVIDPYQVDEARALGADALLLIAKALEPDALRSLHKQARDLGLDVLVEVHDERELELALASDVDLLGVNNRDLRTFEVDLGVTERLARHIPASSEALLVSESGIHTPEDVARLRSAGAAALLVGESLMSESDLAAALRRLRRSP